MAKGKSFFGLKRGSTKSLTFQVLNGQQIVKDRVVDVKNPRTETSNGWLRSTAIFEPGANVQFTPTAENALATYPVGTDYILNGGSV